MNRVFSFSLLAVVLAAATRMARERTDFVERVSWETDDNGPMCGRCDTTNITVASDGQVWIEQGHWAGNYSDWRTRRSKQHVSPDKADRFRQRLAPFRPTGVRDMRDYTLCESYMNDSSDIKIEWIDGRGKDRLYFYFGCDFEKNAKMREAITTAPTLLQIPGLQIPELSICPVICSASGSAPASPRNAIKKPPPTPAAKAPPPATERSKFVMAGLDPATQRARSAQY